ncbi:CCA tRNA nucleotidyltransferase [Candidatus Gottesmanbacteria bacterium]|nr:CCA tRNA nucleotidyltransferase [Candidatus Gottesmanbacteria bacterium]
MKYALPEEVGKTLQKLRNAGFEAYAVGGCVRDLLLEKETKDWDFTTNATPEQILSLFPDGFYDNKFGTVGVPIELKVKSEKLKVVYEITTYRMEHGYSDHRRPDKVVWGTSLSDDLSRRDFTINAMAYDGKKFFDPFEGKKDLEKKLVRAVRNPEERFAEDALRMMRAVRFASELRFTIEEKTFAAIQKHVKLISHVSHERIREELVRILSSYSPADGILLLRNGGLLEVILPEVERCFGVEQKSPKRHHIYDVGTHLVESLRHCPSHDPIVRLATLLHDTGKAETYAKTDEGVITFYNHEILGGSIVFNIAERLRFSKKEREKLVTLVRCHQFTVDERQTDKAIRRFIRNVGSENLDDMLAVRIGDRLGGGATETSWRLELFKKRLVDVQKQPFTVADLKADGNDVMKIYGIGSGPLVGVALDMLFNDVVEGKIKNEREALLQRIEDLKKESKIGK